MLAVAVVVVVSALVLVALNAVEVCEMEDSMIPAEVAAVKAVLTAVAYVGWEVVLHLNKSFVLAYFALALR